MRLKGEFVSRRVWLNGKELTPQRSQNVWNHSPDGFNWGYGGSGPSQLALAVLLEITSSEKRALDMYQDFKRNVIARLPQSDFDVVVDSASWEISKV